VVAAKTNEEYLIFGRDNGSRVLRANAQVSYYATYRDCITRSNSKATGVRPHHAHRIVTRLLGGGIGPRRQIDKGATFYVSRVAQSMI